MNPIFAFLLGMAFGVKLMTILFLVLRGAKRSSQPSPERKP